MAGVELSRLGGMIVNTKKFRNDYQDISREFVMALDAVEKYEQVPEKYTAIILDCLAGSGKTLQDFGIVD